MPDPKEPEDDIEALMKMLGIDPATPAESKTKAGAGEDDAGKPKADEPVKISEPVLTDETLREAAEKAGITLGDLVTGPPTVSAEEIIARDPKYRPVEHSEPVTYKPLVPAPPAVTAPPADKAGIIYVDGKPLDLTGVLPEKDIALLGEALKALTIDAPKNPAKAPPAAAVAHAELPAVTSDDLPIDDDDLFDDDDLSIIRNLYTKLGFAKEQSWIIDSVKDNPDGRYLDSLISAMEEAEKLKIRFGDEVSPEDCAEIINYLLRPEKSNIKGSLRRKYEKMLRQESAAELPHSPSILQRAREYLGKNCKSLALKAAVAAAVVGTALGGVYYVNRNGSADKTSITASQPVPQTTPVKIVSYNGKDWEVPAEHADFFVKYIRSSLNKGVPARLIEEHLQKASLVDGTLDYKISAAGVKNLK